MKLQAKLTKMMRDILPKKSAGKTGTERKTGDQKVTKEIAKKIMADARKHRLSIAEDQEPES
ncbi:MAG: hypothetical protein JSW54_10590 [Fidelibacterota bacterium]|nr:MAG: hypothetical protein JSW54_10590 [Candidatus Neomarinimicrobiota bacterium]